MRDQVKERVVLQGVGRGPGRSAQANEWAEGVLQNGANAGRAAKEAAPAPESFNHPRSVPQEALKAQETSTMGCEAAAPNKVPSM